MIRVFIALSALCCIHLFALPFESFARYKVGYGVFNLGEATASLKIYENGSYETEVSAKATGIAATLSGKRVETYKSIGKVVDGRLLPDSLEKNRSSSGKKKYTGYIFDHEAKVAAIIEESCDSDGCSYSSEMLPSDQYAQDDILTLYHNSAFIFAKDDIKEVSAKAIGSKKPVKLVIPQGDQLKTAQKALDYVDGIHVLVILNQDIFSSKEGELYINLDNDMTAFKAVLKKTVLFGDIWGERIEKRSKGTWDR